MRKMSKKLSKAARDNSRAVYPDDEARFSWLTILLDAYHIVDVGTGIELGEEEKNRKVKVACYPGCSNCCLQPTVPISPLELQGICWYVVNKLEGDTREVVKARLLKHNETPQCPFLVDSFCSVYPLRPHACRILYVFGRPCLSEEEVELTRPEDVWTHSKEVARRATMTMLPYYGITGRRQKAEACEEGYIFSISRPMHEFPWDELYDQMC